MFELPGAKSIRREEILSRTSTSPSPSPPPPDSSFQDGYQRLGKLLNFDTTTTTTSENKETTAQGANQKQDAENGDEDEEQEFEFRLFSAPVARKLSTDTPRETEETGQDNNSNGGTQKLRIRLRSPTPGPVDLSEGRFVNPSRGWEYYFTTPGLLSGSKAEGDDGGEGEDEGAALRRKQFEEVAVSGQHMLGWARLQPWPGCHLPWRVIHLKRQHIRLSPTSKDPSTSTPAVYVREPPETPPKSCKKPGKKRRIQLRKRVTTAEKAKEAEAEKRNRKNREKKIKRRQKARETKAAAVAANGGDPDAVMAGVDDDASSQGGDD